MRTKLVAFIFMISTSCFGNIVPFKAEFLMKAPMISINTTREVIIEGNKGSFLFSGKNILGSLRISSDFEISETELSSISYELKSKMLLLNQKTKLEFGEFITSSGTHDWKIDNPEPNINLLDPLTAQLALPFEILKGKKEVKLYLPNLKNGEIEENTFRVVQDDTLIIDGIEYDCVVVQRIREHENRITKYWLAKSLENLLIKTLDDNDDKTVEITMTKLLSFG
jgi:hypothetical protein